MRRCVFCVGDLSSERKRLFAVANMTDDLRVALQTLGDAQSDDGHFADASDDFGWMSAG